MSVLWWAARAGMADHAAIFTVRSWLFGWFMRMLAQALFFVTMGDLLGPGQAKYLLIGNAMLLVALHGLHTTASTTWELQNGTLALMVASPGSPVLVLAGRSLFWLPDGLACGIGAILLLSPVAGLHLHVLSALAVAGLMLLTACTAYSLGLLLGALVLAAPDLRNVVSNTMLTIMMALCGPEFPRSALGPFFGRLGAFLPLTNALQAVRDVLAGDAAGRVLVLTVKEAAVGAVWLGLAVMTIRLRARSSRKGGAALFLN